jgi:hypothetical protein
MKTKSKNLMVFMHFINFNIGFDGHPKLKLLELKRNKIGLLSVFINLPELKELHLAENKIKNV